MQSYDAERLFLRKGRGGWFWKVMYRAHAGPTMQSYVQGPGPTISAVARYR